VESNGIKTAEAPEAIKNNMIKIANNAFFMYII
jgi:hypothetical protein